MRHIEHETILSQKIRKYRTALILIAAALLMVFIVLILIPPLIPDLVFLILLILFMTDLFVIISLTFKLYNIALAFLVVVIVAIFFRNMRWPLTGGLFTIGFSGISILSYLHAFIFLKNYKHLPFLRYIGFSSSLILSVVCMGLLWKNMHWPIANIILGIGLALFIPFLFAFVFTLPGSDYINWHKTERIVFFRVIIIPMAFVYTLCVLMFVLPELWTAITRHSLLPFDMRDFELLDKPGIYLRLIPHFLFL